MDGRAIDWTPENIIEPRTRVRLSRNGDYWIAEWANPIKRFFNISDLQTGLTPEEAHASFVREWRKRTESIAERKVYYFGG